MNEDLKTQLEYLKSRNESELEKWEGIRLKKESEVSEAVNKITEHTKALKELKQDEDKLNAKHNH